MTLLICISNDLRPTMATTKSTISFVMFTEERAHFIKQLANVQQMRQVYYLYIYMEGYKEKNPR